MSQSGDIKYGGSKLTKFRHDAIHTLFFFSFQTLFCFPSDLKFPRPERTIESQPGVSNVLNCSLLDTGADDTSFEAFRRT